MTADDRRKPMSRDARRAYNEAIGRNIRETMKAAGITQRQLGDAVGIAQPNISAMLSGSRAIPTAHLIGIALALNVRVEDLLPEAPPTSEARPPLDVHHDLVREDQLRSRMSGDNIDRIVLFARSRREGLLKFLLRHHGDITPRELEDLLHTIAYVVDVEPDDRFWWDLLEAMRALRRRRASR